LIGEFFSWAQTLARDVFNTGGCRLPAIKGRQPMVMAYLDQAGSCCPGDLYERVGLLCTAMNLWQLMENGEGCVLGSYEDE